jgi:hypothetical protein
VKDATKREMPPPRKYEGARMRRRRIREMEK